MKTIKTKKIIAGIILLVILSGVYVVFDRKSKTDQNKLVDNSNDSSLSTTTPTIQVNPNTNIGGYTIEEVPMNEGKVFPKPIPDLTKKVVFGNDPTLTTEIKEAINKKISELQSELLNRTDYYEAWIDLGIYQKMAGDYNGAIESWLYVGKLYPTDYVSVGNLGDLYAYFVKDKVMAENYYKQAISKAPLQAYLYVQLAGVYKDIFKDTSKAKAIIEQGLIAIPENPQLTNLLHSLN